MSIDVTFDFVFVLLLRCLLFLVVKTPYSIRDTCIATAFKVQNKKVISWQEREEQDETNMQQYEKNVQAIVEPNR